MTAREAMTIDDVPWGSSPPDPSLSMTHRPRRCQHRHRESRSLFDDAGRALPFHYDACLDCGHVFDPGIVRRNNNNRRRGKAIERRRNAEAGIEQRGALNRSEDGGGAADPIVHQAKSGGLFPVRLADALDAMTVRADQIAVVSVTETPGPGRRARIVAVVNFADLLTLIDRAGYHDGGDNADGTAG